MNRRAMGAVAATLGLGIGAVGLSAYGQEAGQPPNPPAARAVSRPLENVLAKMNRDLGATFLADSSLVGVQAPLPEVTITAENVEDQLDALVKALPRGTVWAKVMLPAPKGRAYRGDDLLEYVLAQARLFGTVGASRAGVIEILGQKLEAQKAAPVVETLALKTYYLIANPSTRAARTGDAGSAGGAPSAEQLTQGLRNLKNLDPQSRSAVMRQVFQSMNEMMRTMNPQERAEFMRGMRSGGDQFFVGGPGGR